MALESVPETDPIPMPPNVGEPAPARLILVESAAKAAAIRPGLRTGDQVVVAAGEWRELESSGEAAPTWVVPASRRRSLTELRASASAIDEVLIATDPGSAGAERSWHLAEALGPELRERLRRVELPELTPAAVRSALARPAVLPEAVFRSIEARCRGAALLAAALRLLPGIARALPWPSLLALRALCDREDEVESFAEPPSFAVRVELAGPEGPLLVRRLASGESRSHHAEQAAELLCRRLEGARFEVAGVTRRRRRVRAPPPFTTVTLLELAFSELRFGAARTGAIAQRLYEGKPLEGQPGVGLVTHWHSESTRVSSAASAAARAWLGSNRGSGVLPERAPAGSGPPGEAIRPTALERDPNRLAGALARDELALYELIWTRFLSSQLAPAVYRDTRCELRSGRSRFGARWSEVVEAGFQGVRAPGAAPPPRLRAGQTFEGIRAEPEPIVPDPPRRYDDGALVREVTERCWAPPQLVAELIEVLEESALMVRRGAELHPTRQGQRAVRQLQERLPGLLDASRLVAHERALNAVRRGRTADSLGELRAALERPGRRPGRCTPRPRGLRCPDCGTGEVVARPGRVGRTFFACSRYPTCRFRSPYQPVPGPCPGCGQPLLFERSTRAGLVRSCRDRSCRGAGVSGRI
jgi:DNA topoisomerase-1